jgi:hypothetical protein
MPTNYEILADQNIARLFSQTPPDLDIRLGAERRGDSYFFQAFGEPCCLSASGITLSGAPVTGPRGLIISLYALHAVPDPMTLEPFKSFKDLPNSMPYQGAFSANSERILIPHVRWIEGKQKEIKKTLDGVDGTNGDFSFTLHPLPKIALCYIFYLDDEEFPASATCLFSSNALSFIPLDGLADTGEYTSKEIIRIIT